MEGDLGSRDRIGLCTYLLSIREDAHGIKYIFGGFSSRIGNASNQIVQTNNPNHNVVDGHSDSIYLITSRERNIIRKLGHEQIVESSFWFEMILRVRLF